MKLLPTTVVGSYALPLWLYAADDCGDSTFRLQKVTKIVFGYRL
jgi:hypothetical protein